MPKARRIFVVHPGEILKTEFMEPMGVSALRWRKRVTFPASMKWCAAIEPSAPTLPCVWESILACPRSFG